MVSIYSMSRISEAEDLRAFLLSCGIPCRIISGRLGDASASSFVNVIENGSDTADGADPESILYSNFDKEEYPSEKQRLYNRILDVLDVKYGINPEFVTTELYCDTYNDVIFCGVSLRLSHTQRLLMKYLAVNNGRWCSADELAACCLINGGTHHQVAVLMDTVRKYVADMTGKLIFETKRGSGYRILTSVKRP